MQSIGERLEEARKRRGISIREASEATKIRGDFLLSFENNQPDIGLPEVYVRGFLRNYANFLKIDAEKIVTDFNATMIAAAKAARRDSRELFGRMEIPERQKASKESAKKEVRSEQQSDEQSDPAPFLSPAIMNYLKVALIISAGIIVVLVIVLLMRAIIGAATTSSATDAETSAADSIQQVAAETVTLVALGNVQVKVTEVENDRELFYGPMVAGESRKVSKQGRVLITYDVGRNLNIEKDGQRFRMSTDGIGRSWFD
jgi:cytoskeletal protein RodZ